MLSWRSIDSGCPLRQLRVTPSCYDASVRSILLTGGAGFLGSLLKDRLVKEGMTVVSIDLEEDRTDHLNLTVIRGDIRSRDLMQSLCREHHFDAIIHCAAILAHAVKDTKCCASFNCACFL